MKNIEINFSFSKRIDEPNIKKNKECNFSLEINLYLYIYDFIVFLRYFQNLSNKVVHFWLITFNVYSILKIYDLLHDHQNDSS